MAPVRIANPSDEIGHRAREVIQSLIDEIHADWPIDDADGTTSNGWPEAGNASSRDFPELSPVKDEQPADDPEKRSIRDLAFLLTDLIPSWADICEQWNDIPDSDKEKAEHYFREQVEPLLASDNALGWVRILEALDLLDLPFWRYPMAHTYEVWAAVKALEALDAFRPRLVIKNGHVALDAASPALVARLTATRTVYAHVQGETKLAKPFRNRRAIKPDLRFSLDDPTTNEETIAIVEFKQRRDLDPQHALEVLTAYSLGIGRDQSDGVRAFGVR